MNQRLICLCNEVSQSTIEKAITRGCKTVSKISNATTAGVGQCGGSCRPVIEKMLEHFLAQNAFLENPNTKSRDLKRSAKGTVTD